MLDIVSPTVSEIYKLCKQGINCLKSETKSQIYFIGNKTLVWAALYNKESKEFIYIILVLMSSNTVQKLTVHKIYQSQIIGLTHIFRATLRHIEELIQCISDHLITLINQ